MRKLFYLVMFYFLHQINILSQNYIDVIGQNSGFGTSAPTGKLHVIVNSTQEEGVRISDGQNGNINIQPIEGGFYSGPSGFQAINFNGFYNNYGGNTGIGGESIYNTH
ncbi:MAG: hypothetical protein IPL35_07730 [Sphingobacteriales bacterium]|nr:hypothetical protein [Sphingobacteriales bacterium]